MTEVYIYENLYVFQSELRNACMDWGAEAVSSISYSVLTYNFDVI